AVRNEKVKVLQAIRPMTPEEVLQRTVRGQYGPGFDGEVRVAGYRSEPNVAADSRTETYGALQLFIENWRWAGVPFYLRSGERLRDAPIRLHGRGFDALPPRRHGRGRVADRGSDPRCLGNPGAARFPEPCGRRVGPRGRGPAHREGRPPLDPSGMKILAGDI